MTLDKERGKKMTRGLSRPHKGHKGNMKKRGDVPFQAQKEDPYGWWEVEGSYSVGAP